MKEAMLKITETLKTVDNEGTAAPFWVIIDPAQNLSRDAYNTMGQITGLWFSRADAQAYLEGHKYNYSNRVAVACLSGHQSTKYNNLWKAINRNG